LCRLPLIFVVLCFSHGKWETLKCDVAQKNIYMYIYKLGAVGFWWVFGMYLMGKNNHQLATLVPCLNMCPGNFEKEERWVEKWST
jgi:hypothetical protein